MVLIGNIIYPMVIGIPILQLNLDNTSVEKKNEKMIKVAVKEYTKNTEAVIEYSIKVLGIPLFYKKQSTTDSGTIQRLKVVNNKQIEGFK